MITDQEPMLPLEYYPINIPPLSQEEEERLDAQFPWRKRLVESRIWNPDVNPPHRTHSLAHYKERTYPVAMPDELRYQDFTRNNAIWAGTYSQEFPSWVHDDDPEYEPIDALMGMRGVHCSDRTVVRVITRGKIPYKKRVLHKLVERHQSGPDIQRRYPDFQLEGDKSSLADHLTNGLPDSRHRSADLLLSRALTTPDLNSPELLESYANDWGLQLEPFPLLQACQRTLTDSIGMVDASNCDWLNMHEWCNGLALRANRNSDSRSGDVAKPISDPLMSRLAELPPEFAIELVPATLDYVFRVPDYVTNDRPIARHSLGRYAENAILHFNNTMQKSATLAQLAAERSTELQTTARLIERLLAFYGKHPEQLNVTPASSRRRTVSQIPQIREKIEEIQNAGGKAHSARHYNNPLAARKNIFE